MSDFFFVLHIGSLCVAGIGILLADYSALGWLRGKRETVPRETAVLAHWVVTAGLAGLVLSGLILFWPERAYLMGEPLFWVKMGFVAALVVNSFFIEYLMHTASHRSFASLTHSEKVPFLASGFVSTMSWLGAGITALVLFD